MQQVLKQHSRADERVYISPEEISFIQTCNGDPVGCVFNYEGKLLRGISPEYKSHVMELLDCGLIEKLTKLNLFPKTHIAKYHTDAFPLVLEHERITPVTYPNEWSFSMLKEAALVFLRVSEIARSYNFFIKDGHTSNMLFKNSSPMFVDFGSFDRKCDPYQ